MGTYTMPSDGGTLDLGYIGGTNGNSPNTNDTIYGSSGDDTIYAGAATEQTYIVNPNAPKEKQNTSVVQDNDTIIESQGTNNLWGGYGNDKFVFNLGLLNSEPIKHVEAYGGAVPTQTAGANTNGVWNSFLSNLEEWRAAMAELHGADQDQSTSHADYTFGAKNQQKGSVDYDNTFTWYEDGGVTTNTSTNYIQDFGNGHDSIELDITKEAFEAAGGTVSFDGSNTVIHVGTFEIVVLGVDQATVESHINWASSA